MSEVKFYKGSEEWQMFMDYWNLCQKYWDPEDNDAYWESLISEADSFYKKYETDFARNLVDAFVVSLDKKSMFIKT